MGQSLSWEGVTQPPAQKYVIFLEPEVHYNRNKNPPLLLILSQHN
jgi:hypothetical protein